jgi:hypothetical protein
LKQKAHLFLENKNLFPCDNITFFRNSISLVNNLGLIHTASRSENLTEGLSRGQQFFSKHGG